MLLLAEVRTPLDGYVTVTLLHIVTYRVYIVAIATTSNKLFLSDYMHNNIIIVISKQADHGNPYDQCRK